MLRDTTLCQKELDQKRMECVTSQKFVTHRELGQEELEEARAGVDRNIKELRDCVRRLRVEGAGAAEAELAELQVGGCMERYACGWKEYVTKSRICD